MIKVINTVDVPRGGWRFTVAATGVVISAGSINSLKRNVYNHMQANGIEFPPGIDEEIEATACVNLGEHMSHWCKEVDPTAGSGRKQSRWRAADVLRFLKTILAWGVGNRFQFVPKEEAERRAAICATCPLNVSVSGCLGCSGVAALVKAIRGSNTTSVDNKLDVCETCGCELKVKVLVPMDAIDNSGLEFPSWCWNNPAHQTEDGNVERHEGA